MSSSPLRLPPSPDAEFLGVPIPDLSTEAGRALVSSLAWEERQRNLAERAAKHSADWLLESAALARDKGRYDEALQVGADAFQRAFRERSISRACEALSIRASAYHAKGEFESADQVVSQLRLLTNAENDVRLAAVHDEAEASLHLRTVVKDWFADARAAYEAALSRFQKCDDVAGQIRVHAALASTKSGYGTYLASVEHVTAGLMLAAEANEWRYTGRLLLEAALAFRDQGYRDNVEDLFLLAMSWCEFLGDEYNRVRCLEGLGYLYDFEAQPDNLADLARSEAAFNQAIEAAKEIGCLPLEVSTRLCTLHVYQKFGQTEKIAQQRELVDRQAAILLGGKERDEPWLKGHDDYGQFIENLRRDRYLARLRDGIEGVSDPFFVFDPIFREDGTCQDFVNEFRNSAGARLLGVEPSAVRVMADLLRTPYFDGLREPLLKAVDQQEGYDDEISVTSSSGETIWYARRIVPAGDGTVVTFRDASAGRKVEAALREADRAKSEFLANMTHEVRTPIHGVLGLARLLAESDLSPEQQAYVKGIISSGDILLRVVGDVLDVSKIEAQRMEVVASATDVRRLVSDVVGLYRGQASELGLALSGSVGQDVPPAVMLDGARVRQVLGNLVGNAVKFTRVGSIEIGVSVVGERLEFSVVDTGPGLGADQLERIFQPFTQARANQTEGGTGLGLTISRRMAELMGGEMKVTSHPGEGSRFSFSLPLEAAEHPETMNEQKDPNKGIAGYKVLLVEDNPVNVLVAKGLLSKLGCAITVADNGRTAIEMLADGSFDVVLMDVRMPVMDGLAATREIRANETPGTHIPIVALTAGTLVDERADCFAAGMDDYMSKPFTLDVLRSTLVRVTSAAH